jgi:hypothetical protein
MDCFARNDEESAGSEAVPIPRTDHASECIVRVENSQDRQILPSSGQRGENVSGRYAVVGAITVLPYARLRSESRRRWFRREPHPS